MTAIGDGTMDYPLDSVRRLLGLIILAFYSALLKEIRTKDFDLTEAKLFNFKISSIWSRIVRWLRLVGQFRQSR